MQITGKGFSHMGKGLGAGRKQPEPETTSTNQVLWEVETGAWQTRGSGGMQMMTDIVVWVHGTKVPWIGMDGIMVRVTTAAITKSAITTVWGGSELTITGSVPPAASPAQARVTVGAYHQ